MPIPGRQFSIPSPADVLSVDVSGNLCFRDQVLANAPIEGYSASIQPGASSPLWANAPAVTTQPFPLHEYFDDFLVASSTSAGVPVFGYTDVKGGAGGANAFVGQSGGWFNLVTLGANDDYRGLRTLNQAWIFSPGKALWLEARWSLTEAQTNLASILIGLMDATTTGGIQAGSAGPLASFNGAVLHKNQGDMLLRFMTSNGATQNKNANMATITTGVKVRAGFYWDGIGNITPYFDVANSGLTAGTTQAIAGTGITTQMFLVATVKSGSSGATAETLSLDYLQVTQQR